MGAGRPRSKNKNMYWGGRCDARIVTKFQELCHKSGINPPKAFERLMVWAINSNEIPGVQPLYLEEDAPQPLPDGKQREKELDERANLEEHDFVQGNILHDSTNKE
jgi:hypothetical protein